MTEPIRARHVAHAVVPPKGTRGVRFPRFISRIGGRFVARMFRRRPMKTAGGIQTLMLETHGAKTGQPRFPIVRLRAR
jgi:hypothetical protein